MLTDNISILLVEDNDDYAEIISRNVLKFCKAKKLLGVEDGEGIDLIKQDSSVSSIDYLFNAIDIPYFHHEKWDGTEIINKIKLLWN